MRKVIIIVIGVVTGIKNGIGIGIGIGIDYISKLYFDFVLAAKAIELIVANPRAVEAHVSAPCTPK